MGLYPIFQDLFSPLQIHYKYSFALIILKMQQVSFLSSLPSQSSPSSNGIKNNLVFINKLLNLNLQQFTLKFRKRMKIKYQINAANVYSFTYNVDSSTLQKNVHRILGCKDPNYALTRFVDMYFFVSLIVINFIVLLGCRFNYLIVQIQTVD